ncbi:MULTISPECIES: hypothetical protein [Methylosinus]|nr:MULTISPECIES: hypothetical protein [Methylosinus]
MGDVTIGGRASVDKGIARVDKGFFIADGGDRLDMPRADFSFDSRRGAH